MTNNFNQRVTHTHTYTLAGVLKIIFIVTMKDCDNLEICTRRCGVNDQHVTPVKILRIKKVWQT